MQTMSRACFSAVAFSDPLPSTAHNNHRYTLSRTPRLEASAPRPVDVEGSGATPRRRHFDGVFSDVVTHDCEADIVCVGRRTWSITSKTNVHNRLREPVRLHVEGSTCVVTAGSSELARAECGTKHPAPGVYRSKDVIVTVAGPRITMNGPGSFQCVMIGSSGTVADVGMAGRPRNGIKDGHVYLNWLRRDLHALTVPDDDDCDHAWLVCGSGGT